MGSAIFKKLQHQSPYFMFAAYFKNGAKSIRGWVVLGWSVSPSSRVCITKSPRKMTILYVYI